MTYATSHVSMGTHQQDVTYARRTEVLWVDYVFLRIAQLVSHFHTLVRFVMAVRLPCVIMCAKRAGQKVDLTFVIVTTSFEVVTAQSIHVQLHMCQIRQRNAEDRPAIFANFHVLQGILHKEYTNVSRMENSVVVHALELLVHIVFIG